MSDPERERPIRPCDLCRGAGANACIRMVSGMPGQRQRPVYGHADCARERGIIPLYHLVVPGSAR